MSDQDRPARDEDRGRPRTGAEQQWEPEDLARAQGEEPTPENVERHREELRREGRQRIEKSAP